MSLFDGLSKKCYFAIMLLKSLDIKNFKSLLAVILGIILGIISGYNFINYTLIKFNMPVMIFFIGFMYKVAFFNLYS